MISKEQKHYYYNTILRHIKMDIEKIGYGDWLHNDDDPEWINYVVGKLQKKFPDMDCYDDGRFYYCKPKKGK